MIIGAVECEFLIYDTQSLKEKRSILQRVMKRTKQKFNVALSEVDHQNVWQRTAIAVVTVASAQVIADQELQRVLQYMDSFPELERTITEIEWL